MKIRKDKKIKAQKVSRLPQGQVDFHLHPYLQG